MPIYRGEMFYVFPRECVGSEQQSGRPAIVVSNDINNAKSSVVEVVYLTAQEKNYLPTHVGIKSAPRESIALCEQIHSVSIDRLGDYVGRVTQQEMQMIDVALLVSLQLDEYAPSESVPPCGQLSCKNSLSQ